MYVMTCVCDNIKYKNRYLPSMCRGEKILAIAMTEPGAGSDLAGVRTTATKVNMACVCVCVK
jgi:alkylation response protein AidB-like acyl-CoA dehydrogenase